MKLHTCKVGTIPSRIELKYNYKIEVGKIIKWRNENEFQWRDGEIWKVNDEIVYSFSPATLAYDAYNSHPVKAIGLFGTE